MKQFRYISEISLSFFQTIPLQVRFRLGFKTDWDDVTGDIDDDELDDATLPRMNPMTLWTEDKAQLDLLLKEHQAVDKSLDTEEGYIKSLLGFNKGSLNYYWFVQNARMNSKIAKQTDRRTEAVELR